MLFATRAPVREYVAALLAVIAALLLTLLLRQVLDILIFPIFLAAVMFSAWYGGLGPGLFATLLAAVATSFILVQPPYSLTVELTIATRVGTFVLAALFISSLNEASRRAAAELRRQREELRVTLASIGDAVIVADAHGRVTFANQAAQDLTGWGQSEAQGQALETIFTIVDEQTRRPVESPVDRILREGTVVGLANHTLLIARGGQEIPIDDSAAPIKDAQGQTTGVVLVFRGIAERRQAEAALRASEERLRSLADAMPLVVWTATPAGDLDYYNQRWYDYTGMTPAESYGWGWKPVLHPDDLQLCVERWTAAVRTGEPYQIEYRWRRADGVYRWHLGRALPVGDQAGRIAFWVGTGTDIDDQKQAEDRQRFLAEAGALLSGSLDYAETFASLARLAVPRLADWCAVHTLEDGVVRRLALVHVDQATAALVSRRPERYPLDSQARHMLAQVLRSGAPELFSEAPDEVLAAAARDDEHLKALRALGCRSYMCLPLIAHGRTLGAITFAISESNHRYGKDDLAFAEQLAGRAALAIENARLYREAQDAIRARDQFLSIASHELKTPLTSLIGYTDLLERRALRDGGFSARDQRAVRVISEQSARLNKLVAALLDLSRIETGQLSIERGMVDLGALARRLVEQGRQTLDQGDVTFSGPDEPLVVVGDELRLEQVVQNLIQNAIKYSPGGGAVEVAAERRGDSACLSVRDHGIGIPEAALPRLFRRFYRAPNAESQHIGGMGVGLYVVKEIVTLHGGTVAVTSAEGVGSTFTVCIPLLAARDQPAEASHGAEHVGS